MHAPMFVHIYTATSSKKIMSVTIYVAFNLLCYPINPILNLFNLYMVTTTFYVTIIG